MFKAVATQKMNCPPPPLYEVEVINILMKVSIVLCTYIYY